MPDEMKLPPPLIARLRRDVFYGDERLARMSEHNPLHAEAADVIEALSERIDAAYQERNQVVAALASVFPAGIARTAIPGWDEEWHGCVYIDLPTGQASWHYHDREAHLFAHLPPYAGQWDGHTTEEKYERVAALNGKAGWVPSSKLPCDVRLPPNTIIRKGCRLSALHQALTNRVGQTDQGATTFSDAASSPLPPLTEEEVQAVARIVKFRLGRQLAAVPLLGDDSYGDWYAEGGSIDLEDLTRAALSAFIAARTGK